MAQLIVATEETYCLRRNSLRRMMITCLTFDDVELSPNIEPQPQESESVAEPASSPRHSAESDVPASASRTLRRSSRIHKVPERFKDYA